MKRFLVYWLVLTPTLLVASILTALLGFHHVDLNFDVFASLVLVPPVQALLLAWLAAPRGGPTPASLARRGLASWPVRVVAALDLLVLGTGWLVPGHPVLGVRSVVGLPLRWTALKCFVAMGVALVLASRRGRSAAERGLLVAAATALACYGVDRIDPWLGSLTSLQLFSHHVNLVRWVVVYALPIGLLLGVLVALAGLVRRRTPEASLALDGATALLFTTVLVAILGTWAYASLGEPTRGAVRTFMSLSVSLALAAMLLDLRERHGAEPAAEAGAGGEPEPSR